MSRKNVSTVQTLTTSFVECYPQEAHQAYHRISERGTQTRSSVYIDNGEISYRDPSLPQRRRIHQSALQVDGDAGPPNPPGVSGNLTQFQYERSEEFRHMIHTKLQNHAEFIVPLPNKLLWEDFTFLWEVFHFEMTLRQQILKAMVGIVQHALERCSTIKSGSLQHKKSIECLPPEGGALRDEAHCKIVLDMDYSAIDKEKFITESRDELALKLNIDKSMIDIKEIKKGSIEVAVIIGVVAVVVVGFGAFVVYQYCKKDGGGGDGNAGDGNAGDGNAGDGNAGDGNAGAGNGVARQQGQELVDIPPPQNPGVARDNIQLERKIDIAPDKQYCTEMKINPNPEGVFYEEGGNYVKVQYRDPPHIARLQREAERERRERRNSCIIL